MAREGFDFVFDVPSADDGISAADAARRFRIV